MIGSFFSGLFSTIWRTLVVLTGFCLAGLTAIGMLLYLGGQELAGRFSQSEDADSLMAIVDQVVGTFMFASSLGPALTLVPALGAIVVGEVAGIRSAIYYVLAGGLAVLAIPFLYETGDGISGAVNSHYVIVFLASGFIAGFIYWVVAGRSAYGVATN